MKEKECPFCGNNSFEVDAESPSIGRCSFENKTFTLAAPPISKAQRAAVGLAELFNLPHPNAEDMTPLEIMTILRAVGAQVEAMDVSLDNVRKQLTARPAPAGAESEER